MDVLRLIVTQRMRPIVFELVAGLIAAFGLGPFDRLATLPNLARNPLLLAATMSILGAAALAACLFPARRARLVNLSDALRVE